MLLLPLSLVHSPAADAAAAAAASPNATTAPFSAQLLLPLPSHAGALLCETLGPEEVLCRVLPQVQLFLPFPPYFFLLPRVLVVVKATRFLPLPPCSCCRSPCIMILGVTRVQSACVSEAFPKNGMVRRESSVVAVTHLSQLQSHSISELTWGACHSNIPGLRKLFAPTHSRALAQASISPSLLHRSDVDLFGLQPS